MRVMVTGSRSWDDVDTIREMLGRVDATNVTLIHGDAHGADSLADAVARYELGWDVIPFPADWKRYGKAAGPIRNQEMVDTKPDVCFAFPTNRSKGTWDAVRRAREAGIEVILPGASEPPQETEEKQR